MKTSLDHLPEPQRAQIQAISALIQAETPAELIVLFGSYARGDWVVDVPNGYISDFDILVVVATPAIANKGAFWASISDRAQLLAGRTPVSLIVHDIKDINFEIRMGQYFFIDILREGVLLHGSRGFSFAKPSALSDPDRLELGSINFRYWFGSANEFWRGSGHYAARELRAHAAFLLHQATERYFHALLLVYSGYKPKTHDIKLLASETISFHPSLTEALPRTEPEDERLFTLLKRAYIEARYSKSFKISSQELSILRERVRDFAARVRLACSEKLASFCGPEAVGEIPEVPALADLGELAEVPPSEDLDALREWREALAALSFERGERTGFEQGEIKGFEQGEIKGFEQGEIKGFEQGEIKGFERGELTGELNALFTILQTRGIAVDSAVRTSIEACTDPELLKCWISRAVTIDTVTDLFRLPSAPSDDP